MPLYSFDVKLFATAYIEADSKAAAQKKAEDLFRDAEVSVVDPHLSPVASVDGLPDFIDEVDP